MERAAALLLILGAILMTPAQPGGAERAAAQPVTWRQPAGYCFEHPAGWRVEPRAQGMLILPGDVALDGAGTALDMIALSSQSAPSGARFYTRVN